MNHESQNPIKVFFAQVVSDDKNIGKEKVKSFSTETKHDVKALYPSSTEVLATHHDISNEKCLEK